MKKPILNESILLNWQEIDAQNWLKIVTDIADIYFETALVQKQALNESWKSQSLDSIKRVAHTLKSTCGNVGAEQAHSLLDQIEKQSENGNLPEISKLMNELEPVFKESYLKLSEFLKTHQAA